MNPTNDDGIEHPNPRANFVQLRYSYRF